MQRNPYWPLIFSEPVKFTHRRFSPNALAWSQLRAQIPRHGWQAEYQNLGKVRLVNSNALEPRHSSVFGQTLNWKIMENGCNRVGRGGQIRGNEQT